MPIFYTLKLLTLVVARLSSDKTLLRIGRYGRRNSGMIPAVFFIAVYPLLFLNYILAMS